MSAGSVLPAAETLHPVGTLVPDALAARLVAYPEFRALRVAARGDPHVHPLLVALIHRAYLAGTGHDPAPTPATDGRCTEWLSTRQAADRLHLSPRSVRRLVETGRLPATRVGHAWLVATADVQRYRGDAAA